MTTTQPFAYVLLENVLLAAFYLGLGAPMLALTLQRAQEVPPRRSQQDFSFCELYLPEKNTAVLRYYSLGLGGLAVVGTVLLALATLSLDVSLDVFVGRGVVPMLGFLTFGAVTYLESIKRLAPDSHRIVLALASAVLVLSKAGLLLSKDDEDNQPERIHELGCAVLDLATAFTITYSVHSISNMVAFVMGWALPALSGFWCLTVLPFLCCNRDDAQLMMPLLALEASLLCLAIFMVVALCIPSNVPQPQTAGEAYQEYDFDQLKGAGGGGEDGSCETDSRDDASNVSNPII